MISNRGLGTGAAPSGVYRGYAGKVFFSGVAIRSDYTPEGSQD